MSASYKEWEFQIVDQRTGLPIDDDTGKVAVLMGGTNTSAAVNPAVQLTLYTDDAGTTQTGASATVPQVALTLTNGRCRFYTASTVTSVDLSILTADGHAVFVEDFTPSDHRVVINRQLRSQTLILPYLFLAAGDGSTEVDTGFDLPAGCLMDPFRTTLKVIRTDSSETVSVGLLSTEAGGDLDGFLAAAPVSGANDSTLAPIPQITGGTNIDYVGTNYIGALICTSIAGADAVATVGGWTPTTYVTDGTAKSIVYAPSSSDTAMGYIILGYTLIP